MPTLLKRGSKAVSALQHLLNASIAGPQLVVDSDFGAATERGGRQFPVENGLVNNGIAGPQTLTALKQATTPASPASRSPTSRRSTDRCRLSPAAPMSRVRRPISTASSMFGLIPPSTAAKVAPYRDLFSGLCADPSPATTPSALRKAADALESFRRPSDASA